MLRSGFREFPRTCIYLIAALLLMGCSTQPSFQPTKTPTRHLEILAPVVEYLDNYGRYASGPEWEDAKSELLQVSGNSWPDYFPALRKAVAAAGGKHSYLIPNSAANSVITPAAMPPQVSNLGGQALIVPGTQPGSGPKRVELAQDLAREIESKTAETCGWIIDLRSSLGGYTDVLLLGFSPLLPDGESYGLMDRNGKIYLDQLQDGRLVVKDNLSWPLPPYASELDSISVGPVRKSPSKPIAILQGHKTASAAEITIAAFRGLPNVKTFGSSTAGYTSGNIAIPLPENGPTIVLTVATVIDRTGKSWPEIPIPPDHPTANPQAEAEFWLDSQGCRNHKKP